MKTSVEAWGDILHAKDRRNVNYDNPTRRTLAYLIELVLRFGSKKFHISELLGEDVRQSLHWGDAKITTKLTDATVLGVFLPKHDYIEIHTDMQFSVTSRGIEKVLSKIQL